MPTKNIRALNADFPDNKNISKSCDYFEVTECPSCHYAVRPTTLTGYYLDNEGVYGDSYSLYVLYQCPNCRQVFLTRYSGYSKRGYPGELSFHYENYSVPYSPSEKKFSEAIKALSPNFVETYNQSDAAESQQMYQICGVGYRKALEYLVKDYLCHMQPDNAEKIRSEFLGACIKRIDNNRIKTLAERSVWIGNDETHYVRKHENLDIADLKKFINATVTYIESELAFEEAERIEPK